MGPRPRRRRRGALLLPPPGDEVLAQGRRGLQGRRHRRVEGVGQGEARRVAAMQAARRGQTDARLLPPRRQALRLAHARVPPPPRRPPTHPQPVCSPCDLPWRGGRGHGLGGLPHFQEDKAAGSRCWPWQRRRRGGDSVLTIVVRHRQLRERRPRGGRWRTEQQR